VEYVPDDEDRDGPRNVGLLTTKQPDATASPRTFLIRNVTLFEMVFALKPKQVRGLFTDEFQYVSPIFISRLERLLFRSTLHCALCITLIQRTIRTVLPRLYKCKAAFIFVTSVRPHVWGRVPHYGFLWVCYYGFLLKLIDTLRFWLNLGKNNKKLYVKTYIHLRSLAMTGLHNWNSILCVFRSEAEETVEHRARSIVNVEYRSLISVIDYKSPGHDILIMIKL
jgi:hypothetical protein